LDVGENSIEGQRAGTRESYRMLGESIKIRTLTLAAAGVPVKVSDAMMRYNIKS
jgi:hypothetical protein